MSSVDHMASMLRQWQSAKTYCETSRYQKNSGYEFLQQLSPVRSSTALDLGCGTGYLAVKLSDCVGPGGRVIAVDPDGERLKIAQEKYPRDNIEYVNGNDATFPEGPYDLVFSNQVVHWVADKDALLRRVYESLKSGGRFAFTTADGNPVWPPVASKCMDELVRPDFIGSLCRDRMYFLTCGQYQELAMSHGFIVTSMEDKDVPGFHIESVSDLVEFFFGLLHGELDQAAIDKQAQQTCREKYDDDLLREAELYPTTKILHVVLTKP